MMNENMKSSICERAEEMVAYLYGEASEREASDLERHTKHCAACRDELAAFSRVRHDVIEWRNQSLPSFEFSQQVVPLVLEAEDATRKRSVLAALREFFTLSPVWMRAATAMAVVIVCALVVFTVAHFYEQPRQVIVERVVPAGPTQAQLEEMVNRRAEELRRKEKQEAELSAQVKQPVGVAQDNGTAARVKAKRSAGTSTTIAKQQRSETPDKVYASQEARQQLAELVQRQKEDDGLPQLSDLVDDSNQ